MPRRQLRLWLLLATLLLQGALVAAAAEEVHVRWVPDGDTVRLVDGRWVRLAGIDAPETGVRDGRPQYYAAEARARLQTLAGAGPLRLDVSATDRYGRLVGWLENRDGELLNEVLVAEGLAFVYHHADGTRALQQRLLAAQLRAMDAQRGFWPEILTLPAPAGGWIGNRRSHRFHAPDSPHAGRIAERNRIVFSSTEAAFRAGHAPARGGFPWPAAQP